MEARLHGRYGKSDVVAYVPIMAGSQIETYIAVEPHPENFSVLKEQMTRQQPGKRTSLRNIAIFDRDGVIRFHWDHDNRAHRIALDNGFPEVSTLCIPTLLDREGVDVVDLVKIDDDLVSRPISTCRFPRPYRNGSDQNGAE
jgi:FkbM family methyltransferase